MKLIVIYLFIQSIFAYNITNDIIKYKLYPQKISKTILINYKSCNNDKIVTYGLIGIAAAIVAAPIIAPAFAAAGLYGAAAYSSGLATLGGGAIAAGGAGMAGGMIVLTSTGVLSGIALSKVGIDECMKKSLKLIPDNYRDIIIIEKLSMKYVGDIMSYGELKLGIPHGNGRLYKKNKLIYNGKWINGTTA